MGYDINPASTSDPVIAKARFGDGDGEVDLSKDGIELIGDATVFDDMRTNPVAGAHNIGRAPNLETVANDGSVGDDYCVNFAGGHGYIASYSNLDSTDEYTLEFWINPDSTNNHKIFHRDGFIEVKVAYEDLVIQVDNSWNFYATDALVVGSTQHVVITIDWDGSYSWVYVYVNGVLIKSGSLYGYQLAASTSDVYVASNALGNRPVDGRLDNLICYNKALTASQVSERYNGGEGTNTLPTGITEATDVTMRFDFDEGTGATVDNNCTLGAGQDMTLSGTYTWVDGLLGITTGSIGVLALAFPADAVTEIFGSVQFSHKYKEGTLIEPHVHFAGEDTSAGNIVWGLEYLWVNVGGALQANTTLVTRTVANDTVTAGLHRMINVPSAGIAGTGKTISSILQYRLYRDGSNALDTYSKKVYLSEFDIHIEINTMGSKTVGAK